MAPKGCVCEQYEEIPPPPWVSEIYSGNKNADRRINRRASEATPKRFKKSEKLLQQI